MNLSCPQCGLQLAMNGPRHEYCPRCLLERDQPVPLVASSLFKRDAADPEKPGAGSGKPKAANVARSRHAF
jgi:hypothetical protein